MGISGLVTFLTIGAMWIARTTAMPWHASCSIDWIVPTSCQVVEEKLIGQMNAWKGRALCPGVSDSCPKMPCGQKCLYNYLGKESNTIKGEHETPGKGYFDDLTFTFKSSTPKSCSMKGYSTSRTWYAVLDWGTNYCNLQISWTARVFPPGRGSSKRPLIP